MSKHEDKYGDTLIVDACGGGVAQLSAMDQEYLFEKSGAEQLAAAIVVASDVYDGKRDFKCSSGDMQKLSPRRAPGGHVSMILTDTCGAGYLGEVILTPSDAMALAMELIRMASHE